MTYDLLKLAEECEKREVHFKQWYETLNETELFHKLATALREAHAEIKRLRKVIENAPHDEKCAVAAYWKHNWEGDVNCTCWKREAGNE